MRLVTYSRHGEPPAPGIACRNGAVIDVAAVLGHNDYPTVARLIGAEKDTFDRLANALASGSRERRRLPRQQRVGPGNLSVAFTPR